MAELDDKYLLVSDSNETSSEYDSRKLSYSDFLEIARGDFYKKHLNVMDDYLPKNQFKIQSNVIDNALKLQRKRFETTGEWTGRFKVVDGQVIFVDVEEFEKFNENLPTEGKYTPLGYVRTVWDVTQDYKLTQVMDCMIRGMTEVVNENPVKPANATVGLKEENMPPHMHHSGITRNADIQSMRVNEEQKNVAKVENGIVYDIFKNDSMASGLDNNELEGVVDQFNVLPCGEQDTSGEEPKVFHDNLPPLRRYYVFVVNKV